MNLNTLNNINFIFSVTEKVTKSGTSIDDRYYHYLEVAGKVLFWGTTFVVGCVACLLLVKALSLNDPDLFKGKKPDNIYDTSDYPQTCNDFTLPGESVVQEPINIPCTDSGAGISSSSSSGSWGGVEITEVVAETVEHNPSSVLEATVYYPSCFVIAFLVIFTLIIINKYVSDNKISR